MYGLEQQGVDVGSTRVQAKADQMQRQERKAVAIADRLICVSNGLKKHLQDLTGDTDQQAYVIPSAADSQVFCFDDDVRGKTRQELRVSDRTVITYCGSFVHRWQVPDKLVDLVLALKNTILAKPFFLVLTPDGDVARRCLTGRMEAGEYGILDVDHDQVAKYLMASDIGLLLREPHILNQVASPTKFAEYLMCGLPVIISTGIGDTAGFVEQLGGGVVLDRSEAQQQDIDKIAKLVAASKEPRYRRSLSLAASRLLSRQSQLDEILRIYGGEQG
jgi:glycosyltransferase involved in cell wall biosynthesis